MEHRLAVLSDLDQIMNIISDAQLFMKQNGVNQWQNGYPTREICKEDISKDSCYVFTVEGSVAGVISVLFELEKSYQTVEDGAWLTGDAPYAAFHRAAVGEKFRGMGVANRMLLFAENLAVECGYKSIRGDTHRDNRAMRALLEKRGFAHCGTIHLDGISDAENERVCYEKLL